MVKKIVIGAKHDSKGRVTAVMLEGNSTFTSLNVAINMAEKGKVDVVVVNPDKGNKHIRTRPDGITQNNLDALAK